MKLSFFKTWSKQQTDDLDEIIDTPSPQFLITKNHGKLFDLSSISFQCSFGLKNKQIEEEIKKQIKKISVSTPSFKTKLQEEVSKELLKLIKLNGKLFFTTSGSESVANAIKIARQATNKKIILSLKKSYHGSINEALEATGDWRRNNNPLPKHHHRWLPSPEIDPFFKQAEIIIERIKDDCCAIILEPISGKNGVHTPPKSWWTGLENARKKYGFKVIFDEVVCGFFRTGKAFGFKYTTVTPDLICMAKAISGGFIPFGAVFVSSKLANKFQSKTLSAGLTNYAHPLGLASLRAVLKIVNSSSFKERLKENLTNIKKFASKLSQKFEVRQHGLLMAIELKIDVNKKLFLENGFHIIINENVLILSPHLNCPPSILNFQLNRLQDLLLQISDDNYVLKKTG